MSLRDVDRMITTMSLRLPAFRLVRDGKTIPTSRYTRHGTTGSQPITGIADPARILELFAGGATIVLQGMHRFWEPLRRFCRDLEWALGHPTQVNAYITPPGSRGLAVHADEHDVFVLQAFGAKHWQVWPTGADPKLPDGSPVIDRELSTGDAMYLPRGTPHAARTQEGVSGHLTVGILASTWGGLLRDVMKRVATEDEFEEPIPAGYHRDPEGFASEIRERLVRAQAWLDKADARGIAEGKIRSFLTSRPSLVTGGLPDALAVSSLDQRTRVRRRPGSIGELRVFSGRVVLYLGDREVRMPGWLEPAVRDVLARDAFAFAVADAAPDLDDASRLVLVRRLVREGLLEVVRDA